jgi:hypothetical protein
MPKTVSPYGGCAQLPTEGQQVAYAVGIGSVQKRVVCRGERTCEGSFMIEASLLQSTHLGLRNVLDGYSNPLLTSHRCGGTKTYIQRPQNSKRRYGGPSMSTAREPNLAIGLGPSGPSEDKRRTGCSRVEAA